mmetsp:Transcript_31822/g.62587  ORF Transcript_31822/g.62587 Transcript_31822/m.62587 type:complete len:222 (-) Transcript_31822:20-685(-)
MLSCSFLTSRCCYLHLCMIGCIARAGGSEELRPLSLIEVGEAKRDNAIVSKHAQVQTTILSHFTFNHNVVNPSPQNHVLHWIVGFCTNAAASCQELSYPFAEMAAKWELQLNLELLTLKVRFATVDCTVDNMLCNEQGVQAYPTFHRYTKGKHVATLTGGSGMDVERLATWLKMQMNTARVTSPQDEWNLGDGVLDILLVFGALALAIWASLSNPHLWQKL